VARAFGQLGVFRVRVVEKRRGRVRFRRVFESRSRRGAPTLVEPSAEVKTSRFRFARRFC
jgi:hypothetical protein